ncbi:MAG TPA: tetratricopeptide repeat protein [Opitutus sp.]|nr:tetratricopeptide repeat protein [Opitutus sp.]
MMRFSIFLAGVWLMGALAGRAQTPLNPPVPFVEPSSAMESAGRDALSLVAAQRAQEMGFPSAAAAIYRELMQRPDVDREAAMLGLATALLDEGKGAEAERVLHAWEGPRSPAWHLRKGLAAWQQNFITTAKNERDATRIGELAPADRAWHLFLQGLIATSDNEPDKAVALFDQAIELAVSPPARAQILLKREQVRLQRRPVSEMAALTARKNMEEFQGRARGYEWGRVYATTLDELGRKAEAVAVLQRQLLSLPAEERGELDDTRLLLGLIGGASEGPGRSALERLLERGNDRNKQRIALQALAEASTRNPQLAAFRRLLDELVAAKTPHPLLEDLYLYRAQVALTMARAEGGSASYAQAETDARTLLQTFPGSPLKAHAYAVLTQAAWEQRRYRTAADNAVKARAELPEGASRAALGLLIAEAWFRAGDYRSAADAYAAVLREGPAKANPGELMFQRVLSEIRAGTPEVAVAMLDDLARDPGFDQVNRWEAEWNLARALQVRGKTDQALERVNRVLDSAQTTGARAVPTELRARMAWLQARLAFAAGRPEQTLQLVEAFSGVLANVAPALRDEIASSGALLKAEASFALDRDAAALETLKKLRTDYPRSVAAVSSYFVEAKHYSEQDKTVEAQQLLIQLAEQDSFPEKQFYAPFALFQAALQAERRGQEANYREAYRLIEDLVGKYPQSDLVFAARMKQGDLLRKLNDFPAAQRVYEELVNRFSQRPDVALAQLALAETHNAQSANEPSHAESALVLFEHVRDRVDAPLDARVEAGFNLGLLRARRGEPAKAEEVWWRDVVTEFLIQPGRAEQLSDKGRYWMTRTLLELGGLYEQQEKLEQAKQAWLLILEAKLGYGEALARARLARFGLPEAKA